MTDKEAEELDAWVKKGEYDFRFSNASHLRFIPGFLEDARNMFFNKQWRIIKTSGNKFSFFTSDNPVAEWMPNVKSFWGRDFFSRKHYLPLTPNLLLELTMPDRDVVKVGPHDTVTYVNASRDNILMYDILIANHCMNYAYSKSDKEFKELLKQLKTPGKATLMYFKKYIS